MEDDFILGMDLISRHGLTIDPVREVLRLGNEEFELNQRCIEDDQWTTARCRNDQEEDDVIGPLLRWKEDGIERPGWSEISGESPSFKALWD